MTPNELRKILAQDENPKLEFKIDYSLTRDEEWNELIKDILALANGNVGFSHLPGYLVIGASDAKKPEGSRDLKDASQVPLKKHELMAKVNSVCSPRLPNLEFDWITFDGAKILVITIPPTRQLYETKTWLQVPKRRFQEQTVFIRCGDEIQTATQQERDAILADKRNAIISIEPMETGDEIRSWELITDPNVLLPKLYNEENNDDPLAYHRIPYQPRDPERDIQLELRAALSKTRYLLITGRSGLGKTREAGMLARDLMLEGYRVIRIKHGLLDAPRDFPHELEENHRRILILIDDLNFLFRTGELATSRIADKLPTSTLVSRHNRLVETPDKQPLPTLPSYHDRLLEMLDTFENWCDKSEIRVIATARDDTDSWQVLNYSPKDRLWKHFTRFDLPIPKDSAVVDLLNAELANGNVQAKKNDFAAIARENDGTFANVVSNLRRVRKIEQSLTIANYIPTLEGSWREVYERAVAKHPAVRYVYDAIDVLQQVGAELYVWLVEPTACLLWQDRRKRKATRERQVKRALEFLTQDEIIVESDGKLAPRDGQIEAKGQKVDWKQYFKSLQRLMLRLATRRHRDILGALDGFATVLLDAKQSEEAIAILERGTILAPQDAMIWNNYGVALTVDGRVREAEQAYLRAIDCNPDILAPYINLASWYVEYGNDLINDKKFLEAVEFLHLAMSFNRESALDAIRDSFLPFLEELIEGTPDNLDARYVAAFVHREIGNTEAMHKHCDEARELILFEDWYNLARLESILGNTEAAFEHLLRATEQEDFDPAKAQHDPALSWIRDDPRFSEMVVVSTDTLDDTEEDSEE